MRQNTYRFPNSKRSTLAWLFALVFLVAMCTSAETPEHTDSISFERVATIGLDQPDDAEGEPLFGSILDLAVDSEGHVYVLDPQYRRIQIFTPDGDPVRTVQLAQGTGPGEVQRPTAVSIGPDGTLYVLDFMARKVLMFDPEGQFLQDIPALGMTTQIHATGDRLVLTRLWLTGGDDILHVHAADGTFLTQFLKKPAEAELIARTGNFGRMASTSTGSLLYSYPYPYRIVELEVEGTLLREATGHEPFSVPPTPAEQGMVHLPQRSNGLAVVSDDLVVNAVMNEESVSFDLFDENLSYVARLDSTQTGMNSARNMVSDGNGHLYFSENTPVPHVIKVRIEM